MPFLNNTISQYDLIQGCVRNDRRTQELLFKKFCKRMFSLCLFNTKNELDAITLLQSGFLIIFQQIHKFDPVKSSLHTWMHASMTDTSMNFLMNHYKESFLVEGKTTHEPVVDELWLGMKKVLEAEMPEESEKRRFFARLYRSQLLFALICFGGITAMTIHIRMAHVRDTATLVPPLTGVSKKETTKEKKSVRGMINFFNLQETNYNSQHSTYYRKPDSLIKRIEHIHDFTQPLTLYPRHESITNTGTHKNGQSQELNNQQSKVQLKINNNRVGISNQHVQKNLVLPTNQIYDPKHDEESNETTSMLSNKIYSTVNKRSQVTRLTTTGFPQMVYEAKFPVQSSIFSRSISTNSRKSKLNNRFAAGISISMNLPVSQQEMSNVSMNGEKNSLWDYLPSVYGQYHFNKQLFVQAEFQFVSPQYTPQLMLSQKKSDVRNNYYKEYGLLLHKLYYLNLPISIHYSPVRNLYVGTGLQYAHLKRTVFMQEECTWENGPSGWKMTSNSKTVQVRSKSKKERKNNGNVPATQATTQVETVAKSFQSNDWRWMLDAHYDFRRLNAGIRFNRGLDQYIKNKTGNIQSDIKDKNKSFQFYVRYQIFSSRKKFK